jgi:hypothetical protein
MMMKDMTAIVAAAAPHRGIGYQGQLVSGVEWSGVAWMPSNEKSTRP